eukprot:CAMPEP_0114256324 /NCGR_PEP_ID=MMETSP0058-20121206/18085_1 /TAXON_ID=36894 /ORGANISM="Pyramimonas parkeae, CCMP726" /LENGTH=321 /DNA_ID=CAMNT_0001370869 /DNA_START=146 /DNA_END=1111 /DNA_ORIENTATION=-
MTTTRCALFPFVLLCALLAHAGARPVQDAATSAAGTGQGSDGAPEAASKALDVTRGAAQAVAAMRMVPGGAVSATPSAVPPVVSNAAGVPDLKQQVPALQANTMESVVQAAGRISAAKHAAMMQAAEAKTEQPSHQATPDTGIANTKAAGMDGTLPTKTTQATTAEVPTETISASSNTATESEPLSASSVATQGEQKNGGISVEHQLANMTTSNTVLESVNGNVTSSKLKKKHNKKKKKSSKDKKKKHSKSKDSYGSNDSSSQNLWSMAIATVVAVFLLGSAMAIKNHWSNVAFQRTVADSDKQLALIKQKANSAQVKHSS